MTKNVSTTCCLSIVHVFSVAYTFHSSFTAADRQLWPLPDPRADKHGGEAEATLGSTSGQGARESTWRQVVTVNTSGRSVCSEVDGHREVYLAGCALS